MVNIEVSPEFKRKATLCILSIFLFIIVYFLLLGIAFATAYYSGLLALAIVSISINFLTILVGIGLLAIGLLLVVFMLKFLFQSNNVEEAGDVEITRKDAPQLFDLIDEVVGNLEVKSPKKVFLTPDVNASVVYNSSFWSMFFPVRKNLRIGLGLLNTLNREEMRAVIAHEFGHFSQRSMAVGSYVYTVNQVIFNLVNNDDSFNKLAGQIASVSTYVYPFVWLAMKAVQGARWLLAQMYKVVNLSYLGLSREMEYHADAVAAALGGGHGLASGLRRIDLASHCFQQAINFAGEQLSSFNQIPDVYTLQSDLLQTTAKKDELEFRGELPMLGPDDGSRYLKSKIEIGQQWASHPEVEDRIAHLNIIEPPEQGQDQGKSISLLGDPQKWQLSFTQKMLAGINTTQELTQLTEDEALSRFRQRQQGLELPEVFNGYFNNHNLTPDILQMPTTKLEPATSLFVDERVNKVNALIVLNYDITLLKAIRDKQVSEKTFDYEGVKYHRKEVPPLLRKLLSEQEQLTAEVSANDQQVIANARAMAQRTGKVEELDRAIQDFSETDQLHDKVIKLTQRLREEGEFMQYTLPVEQIRHEMLSYQRLVEQLRESMQEILQHEVLGAEATGMLRESMTPFVESTTKLFGYESYNESAVTALMDNITNAEYLINSGYWTSKRKLMVLIGELVQ